jgi:DMSO/TMAO reductase YedYZ molybdopterin-dependent catalytic subunit
MRESIMAGQSACAVLIAALCFAFFGVAAAAGDPASVSIAGVQPQAVRLSIDEIRKLPAQKARVVIENKEVEYEGVPVSALLAKAGLTLGKEAFHGKQLVNYVIAQARDGYRALFALAEVDPEVSDRPVLLCYARNGTPLPEQEGPFRLILPQEKSQARWMRQVTEIVLKSD